MVIMGKLLRCASRQLHTIASRDVIRPSCPTPSHLRIYNLSLFDQLEIKDYMPMVMFYPNPSIYCSSTTSHDKTLQLKNSLSQTLTHYYPFAGRLAKTAPTYVDCNDEGVEFLEAHTDSRLSEFLQSSNHESLDQLFPDDLVWYNSRIRDRNVGKSRISPLAVQINHFACGGVAVAVSLCHKISDGGGLFNFFNHWAKTTRYCSGEHKHEAPINPHFIPFQSTKLNAQGFSLEGLRDDCVTKSFIFPNSKLNVLKAKITAMKGESGKPIMNATRVEVLNWLLHKCVVAAATSRNSGLFKSTGVIHLVNIRNRLIEPLPETSIGNLSMLIDFPTRDISEMMPNVFISQLKKLKTDLHGLQNVKAMTENISDMCSGTGIEEMQNKIEDYYVLSSLCGYPLYGIDFGWGKPVKATIAGTLKKNSFVLLDTPDGDGIEALVSVGKQEMEIIQNDPELLAFC